MALEKPEKLGEFFYLLLCGHRDKQPATNYDCSSLAALPLATVTRAEPESFA